MPSRSMRRRQHKEIANLNELSDDQRRIVVAAYIVRWRAEAKRRANDLGQPAARALEIGIRAKALAADPCDDLAA